jgi:hypothetical protein
MRLRARACAVRVEGRLRPACMTSWLSLASVEVVRASFLSGTAAASEATQEASCVAAFLSSRIRASFFAMRSRRSCSKSGDDIVRPRLMLTALKEELLNTE